MSATTHLPTTRAQADALFRHLVRSERALFRALGHHPRDLQRALLLVRDAAAEGRLGRLLPTTEPAHEGAILASLAAVAGGSDLRRIRAAFRALGRARITRKALVLLASGPLSDPVLQALDATFALRNGLLDANLGLVKGRVERLLNRGGGSTCASLSAEACQEGSLALQSAIDRFQPRLGFAFSTFAVPGVDAAIREARTNLRGNLRLSEGDRRKLTAMLRAETRLLQQLHREPTLDEIAQALGLPLAEVATVRQASWAESRFDLTAEEAEADGTATPREPHSEETEETRLATVARSEAQAALNLAMQRLSRHQARILELRFGLDGGGERTRSQIAASLNLPVSRVTLLEAKAIQRMQQGLGLHAHRETCCV
jgi:RNA polymerase primary sigma factor